MRTIIPVSKPRNCQKCGAILSEDEYKYCIFCKKNVTKGEQQDIDSWKKREEDNW
jgi:uncharacterized membrane protein YvbJ